MNLNYNFIVYIDVVVLFQDIFNSFFRSFFLFSLNMKTFDQKTLSLKHPASSRLNYSTVPVSVPNLLLWVFQQPPIVRCELIKFRTNSKMWLKTLHCCSRARLHKNGKEFHEVEWTPCAIYRAWRKTKLKCWRILEGKIWPEGYNEIYINQRK